MAEEKLPKGPITLTPEQFSQLMETANRAAERAEAAEKRAEAAEKLAASKKGSGIETTAQRFERNMQERMFEEPRQKQEAKLKLMDEPANIGDQPMVNKDKCPYCIKFHAAIYEKAKQTGQTYEVIDLDHGKYVCRRCGKHWVAWAIYPEDGSPGPMEYSLYLEQGNKEKVEEMEKLKKAKAGLPVSVK
jgi:hypothetical protein